LTSGRPRIVHLHAIDGDEAELLRQAGALQRGSEHPLARAVLDACAERGLQVPDIHASQALSGRGIAGELDGRRLALGNRRLLEEQGLQPGALGEQARAWRPRAAPCPGCWKSARSRACWACSPSATASRKAPRQAWPPCSGAASTPT